MPGQHKSYRRKDRTGEYDSACTWADSPPTIATWGRSVSESHPARALVESGMMVPRWITGRFPLASRPSKGPSALLPGSDSSGEGSSVAAAVPAARRRWYQFRLRTLLALTFALAAGLTFWTRVVVPQRSQQQAAEVLSAMAEYRMQSRPGGPKWLRDWIGAEYGSAYYDVVSLSFSHAMKPGEVLVSDITDERMFLVGRLFRLERLDLSRTSISDDGLAYLRDMQVLEALDLRDTSVSDVGLDGLRGLPALKVVWFAGSKVSDQGIARFRRNHPGCHVDETPIRPLTVRRKYI